MNQINYMRMLEPKEVEEMNREVIEWFKIKIKDENIGSYIYNLLSQLKQLIENNK